MQGLHSICILHLVRYLSHVFHDWVPICCIDLEFEGDARDDELDPRKIDILVGTVIEEYAEAAAEKPCSDPRSVDCPEPSINTRAEWAESNLPNSVIYGHMSCQVGPGKGGMARRARKVDVASAFEKVPESGLAWHGSDGRNLLGISLRSCHGINHHGMRPQRHVSTMACEKPRWHARKTIQGSEPAVKWVKTSSVEGDERVEC